MKFSHSLVFNSKSEWRDHYLDYDSLKTAIYRFEKDQLHDLPPPDSGHYSDDPADLESSALLASTPAGDSSSFNRIFIKLLDKEISKIRSFYLDKEAELTSNVNVLFDEIAQIESGAIYDSDVEGGGGAGASGYEDGDTDSEGEDGAQRSSMARRSRIVKDAIVNIFSDPKKYNQASREPNRRRFSGSQGSTGGGSTGGGGLLRPENGRNRRVSIISQTSADSDLLGPDEADDDLERYGGKNRGDIPPHTAAVLDKQFEEANGGLTLPPSVPNEVEKPRARFAHSGRSRSVSGAVSSSTTAVATPTGGLRESNSVGKKTRRSLQTDPSRLSVGTFDSDQLRQEVDSGENEDGAAIWNTSDGSPYLHDQRLIARRNIRELYSDLCSLRDYVDLNHTGLRKIIKKYDKITGNHLQEEYMKAIVEKSPPFLPENKTRLQAQIERLTSLYARVVTRGDLEKASRQLKGYLREHVVWERNTVWREMVAMERTGGWKGAGGTQPQVQSGQDAGTKSEIKTPVGRVVLPSWINRSFVFGIVALAVFVGLLNTPWFERPEERNCLALLAFVTIMWAAEVIPFFVTSMLVPFLVVTLGVLRSTDGKDRRLTAPEATKFILAQMLNPTIMLLLGGFTIAAALSKHSIDRILATKVMSLAGTKPRNILLANMFIAGFASMWISNVAAPTLCLQLMKPVTRTQSSRSNFSKSLILGIALASNVGGMASPISSPQNLIALEYMEVPLSWLQWFAVALPVASVSIFLIWLLLLWSYAPGAGSSKDAKIPQIRQSRDPFNRTQWFISIVTVAVIVLWCVEHQIEGVVGDMGIIALIPMALFFGTGVLSKDDFDSYPWSIVMLAMGGIALGKAVLSSGLLADVDHVLQDWVQGLDIWPILAVFSLISLVIATFISHTIASVLIVPVAAEIGNAMESPHPRLLIMATALVCSSGMGLPISGYPNLQAINAVDDLGQRYLSVGDFLRNGVPSSLLAMAVIVTIGYALMLAIGL